MEIITIIAFVLVLVALIFIGVDFYLGFKTWFSRIRIGSVQDDQKYYALILNKCNKWFVKTPTVKLTDNHRLVLLDILKGDYKRSTIQHWQKAGLLLGLMEDRSSDTSLNIADLLDKTHPQQIPSECDYVIYAYALLKGANDAERIKYKPYFDSVYAMIVELKKQYQVVPYKSFTGSYMFVDTIGFICPFLALYSVVYGVSPAWDLALNQIRAFNTYGMYPNTSLPVHTYNEQTKMHAGLFGWGRGMGWYAIGLIDVWDVMSPNDVHYAEVTRWVTSFANMILSVQRPDGSYGWNVLVADSRADSSTAVMLTWFLIGASKLPELNIPCQNAIDKSIQYLKSVTRRDGALDFCQGDTKSIGVYSQTFDILPFAQGYLLRILNNL